MKISDGVKIHLEKKIPLAAGLGASILAGLWNGALIGYINMLNLFNNSLQVRYNGEYSLLKPAAG